jgi:hypothetical protein
MTETAATMSTRYRVAKQDALRGKALGPTPEQVQAKAEAEGFALDYAALDAEATAFVATLTEREKAAQNTLANLLGR